MNDDMRYMTWEQRAAIDPRYRPGGKYGIAPPEKPKSVNCECGKTVFVDAFGSPCSKSCPQCGQHA